MNTRGAVYAAIAAMLYGSSYVATGIALRSFTPLSVAAWRGLLAAAILGALLLAPAMARVRGAVPSRAGLVRLIAMGLIGGAIFTVAMNVAVSIAGATVTAFVAGLYAVLAAAFAIPLLGERLERPTLAALLVALVGTILLSELRLDDVNLAGIGVGLVAATTFGLYLVLSRRWGRPYGLTGATIGLTSLTATGVAALAVVLVTGEPLVPADLRLDAAAAIGWLAIGPGVAAAVLVVSGMQRLETRHASAFLLLNPPTAAVLAAVLLGERLSLLQLVGGACVLVAIAAASGIVRSRAPR